jgi:prepilin-type N-terminal cleavage/methylation domain-containing protein
MRRSPDGRHGFTLMELLIVIAMIAILIGIGYPSIISISEKARKTQAANEEQQIVAAVNGFYTDYGKYPLVTADTIIAGSTTPSNADLFYSLRAVALGANAPVNGIPAVNPRAIVFIQPPISKTGTKGGINTTTGIWYDPFGSPYNVMIDGSYDNQLTNPYTDAPSGTTLYLGVIVWSFGKNGRLGGGAPAAGFTTENGTANNFTNSSDVISWQ